MRALHGGLVLAVLLAGCDQAGYAPVDRAELPGSDQALDHVAVPPAPPAVAGGRAGAARPEESAAFSGGAAGEGSALSLTSLQQTTASGAAQTTAPAMLIRTGHATVEVDSLEPAIAAVQALALRVGGYVANVGMQTGRTQLRQATLELKVPAERFDQAMEGLAPLGTLESMNVAVEDVGEEFTDVTARMTNARRLEERLLNLLATRTGRLEDILAAERELARVRQEIERYEGRLRYLRQRTALSTLHITIHEPAPIIARARRNPIAEAFRGAWRNFVGFVAGLIEVSGFLVPLAAILVAAALAWRRWGPGWRKPGTPEVARGAG